MDIGPSSIGEKFYLVSESNLLSLFKQCPMCLTESEQSISVNGTAITVRQDCQSVFCGYKRTWSSQPSIGNVKAGNITLSAALLFAGLSPSKALRFLNHMNVQNISYDTYMKHQSKYLVPAVNDVMTKEHEEIVEEIKKKNGEIIAMGDGRADSPGKWDQIVDYRHKQKVATSMLF